MFENAPDLLTRKECQNLLHVSKSTMLQFIQSGQIPAIIIAGSYRIEKQDLIDFIRHTPYC